jgi:hypothetical protein
MSGLMLGLTITLGGIAVTPIGLTAESVVLITVVLATVCLPILDTILMRFVPRPSDASPVGMRQTY